MIDIKNKENKTSDSINSQSNLDSSNNSENNNSEIKSIINKIDFKNNGFSQKREYHTTTKRLNSIQNNNAMTPILSPSPLSNINRKSQIGEFLSTIKDLINEGSQDD